MHANVLATIALATFPLVIFGLFAAYSPQVATVLSLLLGEMFLPPYYMLPISPSWLGKWTIPPFAIGLAVLIFCPKYLRKSRPFRGGESIFLIGLVGSFFTWRTNMDLLHYGPETIQAQELKDFLGEIVRFIADPWIAFFFGRILFKTSRDLRTLSRIMFLGMLFYTLPILFEIRLSPQLNPMIYGYNAGGFEQMVRWGGFRPLVFFPSGLHLTSFFLAGIIVTVALARQKARVGVLPLRPLSLYLVIVLILCKSTGAILYAALLLPVVYFGSWRTLLWIARILTFVFLVYPFLRMYDLIPTKAIGDFFTGFSADRAQSLTFRFEMENTLMDLTRQRPWWGWGGWGRSFVYDPVTGKSLTVVDGTVIITLSQHGIVGFISYFFPYIFTVFRACRLIKKVRSRSDKLMLAALAANCAVILFDLIINSSFFPIFMLMFGALYGLPSGIIEEEANAEHEAELMAQQAWDPRARAY
jgi:hypothetical protein